MSQSPNNFYRDNITAIDAELKRVIQTNRVFYAIRLFTFLLVITFFVLFVKYEYSPLHISLSAVSLMLFLVSIQLNAKSVFREQYLKNRKKINEEELGFLQHDYRKHDDGKDFKFMNPHLSDDFDLFGEGSLFQYLNRCSTRIGKNRMAESLCRSELNVDVINQRQQAIRELSQNMGFVHDFRSHGLFVAENGSEINSVQQWLDESEGEMKFFKVAIFAFPLLNIAWLFLIVFGVLSLSSFLFPLMISLLVVYFNKQRLDHAHVRLGRTAKIFEKFATLMGLIEKEEFESRHLNELKAKLAHGEIKAGKSLKQLFKLLNNFDVRYNVFVTILLNSLMVFDLQVFCRLGKWKSLHQGVVGGWFDTLAEMDELLGYAVYAFNNQEEVAYPEVSDRDFAFEAVELGHPLLHPSTRVTNSVKFTGKPNVIIVTGANMAGKSTFLRTLSVNLILAMNGAPVCARSFRFTPCDIMSSIKIQDSLSNHESYFYAELLRIKELIDHVKSHPKTLVILDEILRGTNTKDKQLGSLGLLEKLISQNAVAIIATHDLEIGKLEDVHPEVIANYCFEVELQNDQLIFDYKLKKGISSKLNASFLMKKMEIID